MDKTEKALQKLSIKEQNRVKEILELLQRGELRGLNIKKLRGRDDIFRVRKGNVRIIYRTDPGGAKFILAIERKSEKTYKI